ncbi:peptidyl-prolyl cis-trans isomerase [Verrucomicrobium spinosum]|uniref:peptidylprolyl isomerase n=1 Tax=Verrucomicrobium spinosum TaxID=2736 RepID=UPI0001745013|nr:peptidylprolyl isomerase [Verrucomicrobium spinosum]
MKRLLKEPLLHFLLLGAAIFAIHKWRETRRTGENDSANTHLITVNAATVTRLKEGWTRQFQRAPDADDMRGMVEAHIREEVLCREALAIGLDRDDTIVRRRLAQKMEFLTQDIATSAPPDEASINAFFKKNAGRYAPPARVSFRHVYFSREKRGEKLDANAKEALAALQDGNASDEDFGDAFLQPFEYSNQSEADIAGIFGREFAAALMKSPESTWLGPVASTYGVHLVRITGSHASPPTELGKVREQVLRDLVDERRRTANEEVLQQMKKNYEIVIDDAALRNATPDAEKTAHASP